MTAVVGLSVKILFKAMGEQSKASDLGGIMGQRVRLYVVVCTELKLLILSDFILVHVLVVNHW